MTFSSPSTGARRAVVAVAASVLFALPACVDTGVPEGTDPIANASEVATVPPTIGPVGCDPGSTATQLPEGLEVQGAINDDREELWALFDTQDALASGEPIPVYWRIGGDKPLRITLVGPNDRLASTQAPIPKPHPTWERPGEPWMGLIAFPQPGCWRVYVERGKRAGDLWVNVG